MKRKIGANILNTLINIAVLCMKSFFGDFPTTINRLTQDVLNARMLIKSEIPKTPAKIIAPKTGIQY